MALFKWLDMYSVGISDIDEQHKELVKILNDLYQNMLDGKANEVLLSVLEKLVNYTKVHFSHEESVLTRHNYPELKAHKKEHKEFVQKIDTLLQKAKSGSKVISIELSGILKAWLREHISGSDKKYGEFLKGKVS